MVLIFAVTEPIGFAAEANLNIEKFRYLIDATNKITDLLNRHMEPSAEELAEALAEGCKTLELLLSDSDFNAALKLSASAAPTTVAQREKLKSDLSLFVREFLVQEGKALTKAGLSPLATRNILLSASLFHDAVDKNPNAEAILAALKRLQVEICTGAQEMQRPADSAENVAQAQK